MSIRLKSLIFAFGLSVAMWAGILNAANLFYQWTGASTDPIVTASTR